MPPPGRKRNSAAIKKKKKLAAKMKGRSDCADENSAPNGQAHEGQNEGAVNKQKFPVDKILEKAEDCMDRFEYDLARRFCNRALEMDPNNLRALEMTSALLLELGDDESARQFLLQAIDLEPGRGHSKFLSLAQLQTGQEALESYRKGLELLEKEEEGEEAERKAKASSVLCAIAEIFMTDLCDTEGAEEECRRDLELAVEKEPGNAEAHQIMAQFLLVKQEKEEASSCMDKSLSLWLPAAREMLEGRDASSEDPVDPCPLSYPVRISCAQILIELERWEEATEVLEGLLEEDNSCAEPWYLLGLVNYLRREGYEGNARYYFSKALRVHEKVPHQDEALIEHCREMLEEMGPGDTFDSDAEEDGEQEEEFQVESSGDEGEDGVEPMQE